MTFPRGLGYRISHKSAYKHPINKAIPSLPSATPVGHADNMWQLPPVLDQGQLGSCMLHLIAELVYADNSKDGDHNELISILFAYYNTMVLQGELADNGSDPVTAMAAQNLYGLAPEHLWPYDISQFTKLPPSEAYRQAFKKSIEFLWIESTGDQRVNDVKIALDNGYCVGICGAVGPEYCNWKKGDKPLSYPNGYSYGNADYGGHARVIGSYKGRVSRERGSWSEDFGDNGDVLIDDSLVASPLVDELVIFRKVSGV